MIFLKRAKRHFELCTSFSQTNFLYIFLRNYTQAQDVCDGGGTYLWLAKDKRCLQGERNPSLKNDSLVQDRKPPPNKLLPKSERKIVVSANRSQSYLRLL